MRFLHPLIIAEGRGACQVERTPPRRACSAAPTRPTKTARCTTGSEHPAASLTKNRRRLRRDFCEWRRQSANAFAWARLRPCGPENIASFRAAPRARRAGASSRNLKDGKRKSGGRDPSAASPCGRLRFRARGALVRPHAKASALCKSKAHLPEAKPQKLSSPKTSASLTKNRRRLRRDFCEWRRSRARKRAARPHRRAARNRPRAKPLAGLRSARANSRGQSPRRLGSSALHHEKTRHKCTVFFRGGDDQTRTDYLYVANVSLYRVSYIPEV